SLFWLVAAAPPFPGNDPSTLVQNIEAGLPAIDPRFAGLPAPLEQLIRAGLAAEPDRRPTLPAFVRNLRGTLNLLLADCLNLPGGPETPAPVRLRLLVSRQVDRNTCAPV